VVETLRAQQTNARGQASPARSWATVDACSSATRTSRERSRGQISCTSPALIAATSSGSLSREIVNQSFLALFLINQGLFWLGIVVIGDALNWTDHMSYLELGLVGLSINNLIWILSRLESRGRRE
jgi:hypothetical protein